MSMFETPLILHSTNRTPRNVSSSVLRETQISIKNKSRISMTILRLLVVEPVTPILILCILTAVRERLILLSELADLVTISHHQVLTAIALRNGINIVRCGNGNCNGLTEIITKKPTLTTGIMLDDPKLLPEMTFNIEHLELIIKYHANTVLDRVKDQYSIAHKTMGLSHAMNYFNMGAFSMLLSDSIINYTLVNQLLLLLVQHRNDIVVVEVLKDMFDLLTLTRSPILDIHQKQILIQIPTKSTDLLERTKNETSAIRRFWTISYLHHNPTLIMPITLKDHNLNAIDISVCDEWIFTADMFEQLVNTKMNPYTNKPLSLEYVNKLATQRSIAKRLGLPIIVLKESERKPQPIESIFVEIAKLYSVNTEKLLDMSVEDMNRIIKPLDLKLSLDKLTKEHALVTFCTAVMQILSNCPKIIEELFKRINYILN